MTRLEWFRFPDLTEEQFASIRRRVCSEMESIERGEYTEYEGREGLKTLAQGVKARSRRLLARETGRE